MPVMIPEMNPSFAGGSQLSATARPGFGARGAGLLHPNFLVRWAFYISVFAIPFSHLYLPGTGGRVGVQRMVQLLIACGIVSQPRVCLRWMPTALLWFMGYAGLRILWGLWLTPEMSGLWWPSSREFIQLLPWVWVMFNLLQFPGTWRRGLWAAGAGSFLCALFHIAGIGVAQAAEEFENRTSVFGMHANELGATYATAIIALLGLWMTRPRTWSQRFLPFPMAAIIGIAMAKTGSRGAIMMLAIGVLVLSFYGDSFGSRIKRFGSLLVFGAVLTVILWQIPTAMTRFQEIHPQNIGKDNPRARMLPVLWEMFLRSPLYGLGPDGYESELTRRAMPYLVNQGRSIVAHNQVLLLLVETGIIGFLLFSTGLWLALAAAWRARHKPCGPLPLALLLAFVIVAATVTHPDHFLILWVAVAYGLAGAASSSPGTGISNQERLPA